MCDPIIDRFTKVEGEPFRKEVVEEYLKNKNSFNKYPLRHYSQLESIFDEKQVKELLSKLNIPTADTTVTIFGGYTGQFANCLRNIGMQVVFTDPLEEWVKKAIENGFEAYRYAAEEIPETIVKRTDVFATFECYPPFAEPSLSIYTAQRFLTSKYGILFAESKRTRDEMKKEGVRAMLKYAFGAFDKVYSIKRSYREKGDLRLYHFCSSANNKEKIKMDCKVMKLLYTDYSDETYLDKKTIVSFVDRTKMNKEEFLCSLERILKLYQIQIPRSLRRYFPNNIFRIFSKQFHIDLKILRV